MLSELYLYVMDDILFQEISIDHLKAITCQMSLELILNLEINFLLRINWCVKNFVVVHFVYL